MLRIAINNQHGAPVRRQEGGNIIVALSEDKLWKLEKFFPATEDEPDRDTSAS